MATTAADVSITSAAGSTNDNDSVSGIGKQSHNDTICQPFYLNTIIIQFHHLLNAIKSSVQFHCLRHANNPSSREFLVCGFFPSNIIDKDR